MNKDLDQYAKALTCMVEIPNIKIDIGTSDYSDTIIKVRLDNREKEYIYYAHSPMEAAEQIKKDFN